MKKKTSVNIDAETYTYLHGVHVPRRLYELAEIYFIKNAPTIDIGSGCGRDTSWLNHSGFPCIGIEPVDGLRNEAVNEFPKYTFIKSSLPNLREIESSKFNNVFICNVLMFVPVQDIIVSVMNLLRITATSGRIIISIGNGLAEKDGKTIESAVTIWAAGVRGEPAAAILDLPIVNTRIEVEKTLQVKKYPHIFAIGDVAGFTSKDGRFLPMVAPVAMQQGRWVAKQIKRLSAQQELKPFKYIDKGSMATIGRHKAIVEVKKFR